ncbi:hypothetical protein [Fimbriiglobus ruber]|uniref:Exodeoxyribonuclease X-like C-terminal domain-containing protein n=1 Tax=Fimbriiglobus ruber TaxID=1908690 RepID=A0A225DRJ6_9BACT|nr:hypothetical protein [Fimbriiglobus ruber]OWK38737.1 hypothetical protein FRUB_07857 [Fimbriiglobus ruber]
MCPPDRVHAGRYGLPRSPSGLHTTLFEVDVGRRLRTDVNGLVVFAFRKHDGRSLTEVAPTDPRYLEWMLGQAFLDDAHDLDLRTLAGQSIDIPDLIRTPRRLA